MIPLKHSIQTLHHLMYSHLKGTSCQRNNSENPGTAHFTFSSSICYVFLQVWNWHYYQYNLPNSSKYFSFQSDKILICFGNKLPPFFTTFASCFSTKYQKDTLVDNCLCFILQTNICQISLNVWQWTNYMLPSCNQWEINRENRIQFLICFVLWDVGRKYS